MCLQSSRFRLFQRNILSANFFVSLLTRYYLIRGFTLMKSFSFVPISTAIIVSLTLLHNSAYATDQSYMPATQSQQSQADQNKSAGEAFLAANKKNSGVVELPDGLQYKVITQGTGPIATPKDTVTVDYAGTLINGKEFDSSYSVILRRL
jgi:hypothetical protein